MLCFSVFPSCFLLTAFIKGQKVFILPVQIMFSFVFRCAARRLLRNDLETAQDDRGEGVGRQRGGKEGLVLITHMLRGISSLAASETQRA